MTTALSAEVRKNYVAGAWVEGAKIADDINPSDTNDVVGRFSGSFNGALVFVGANALSEELVALGPKYAQGTVVTQVVPLPQSSATAVLKYQEMLRKYAPSERPDFVSLEGYLAGTLLVEGLKRATALETEKVIDALESIRGLDLGTGASLNFGMSEHQASHKVWGTMLDEKGVFQTFQLD